MPFQILWMDVEGPGSYGWGSNGAADRDVFNGFWNYVTNANEGPVPGVYSTNYQWGVIMSGNTGIPDTWEWTAQVSVADSPSPCPVNFLREFLVLRRLLRRPERKQRPHGHVAVAARRRGLRPDRRQQAAAGLIPSPQATCSRRRGCRAGRTWPAAGHWADGNWGGRLARSAVTPSRRSSPMNVSIS
jgi:hypothetical protein